MKAIGVVTRVEGQHNAIRVNYQRVLFFWDLPTFVFQQLGEKRG
ncbi:MAG: hypothetical protein QF660_00500 [Anaerolineales bacterium]|nr:hypothetical protein [Anaerolineales bacterium]